MNQEIVKKAFLDEMKKIAADPKISEIAKKLVDAAKRKMPKAASSIMMKK